MDPGIEVMMEYVKKDKMRARVPPPEDVAQALGRFINHKFINRQPFTDTQAELATKSLRYAMDSGIKLEPGERSSKGIISHKTLDNASRMLKRMMQVTTASHVEFAKLLYDALQPASLSFKTQAALAYVRVLACCGHAQLAREFVSHLPEETAKAEDLWIEVLRAYSWKDDEARLLDMLNVVRARGIKSRQVPLCMLRFYISSTGDNVDQVQTWFDEWQSLGGMEENAHLSSKTRTMEIVLRWCLEHGQLEFGHHVVRQALSHNPPKPVWDAVFVWAAGTGKGADEIDRMLSVMESANKNIADRAKWNIPDIATINALVDLATSKNDPYLAERFIAIGKARDIHPNANTYVLQMKYRLKISDIDGALIAYKNLQSMDLSSNEDVPTVNELIVALCNSKRHDFDTIMNVAADLSDRKARFEPATATALALLHLGRGEMYDVTDLMNTHAYHYSVSERESIRRDLVAYCLYPETPLARVWDAYNVLVEAFDEMPREERTQIMLVFFRRERPDVSVNIFNTMRSHYREDTIPTVDTYVAAFLGAARLRDLDTVEVIHNQLKLDTNINTNTYLLNALIIGYSACGSARRALTFWDDIVASKEGPTYNSIHIALRACENSPFGDVRAERIWAKLRSMSIDLDQALWTSYIAALAGNGNTEKAISTLEEAESKGELEVDAFLLGSLYAGCPGQAPQADVESWCKEKYPQIWEELEKLGVDEDENGMRSFRIDRTVTP